VEEVYDPDFYYRWDLLDNWLPEPVKASLEMPRAEAAKQLVATYLRGAAATQPRFLAGLLGLTAEEVETAMASLEAAGEIRRDARIARLPGSWIVWRGDAHHRD